MSKDTQVVKKLDAISLFCSSKGHDVSNITKTIREKISHAGKEEALTIIDKLWSFVTGNKDGPSSIADIIISGINILSNILSIVGYFFPPASLVGNALQLVACILKIIFQIIDVRSTLAPKMLVHDEFSHEISGLAERLISTELLIRKLEKKAHVEESALNHIISNVDFHIGIDQLGNLKSRIELHMSKGQESAEKSLLYLTLYVRISTLRQSLLVRVSTCLNAKAYSPTTTSLIRESILEERKRDRHYLCFLSLPSLKAIRIAALFDPNEHKEIASYVQELSLPLQDLGKVLHNRVLSIKPVSNEFILLGRPFFSFSSARAMKSTTAITNFRIKFKFSILKNEYNVFHIQSPDQQKYLYMNTNWECKYCKESKKPTGGEAEWKIMRVQEKDGQLEDSPTFVLSTKSWPCKFLFIENSILECAKGFIEEKMPDDDILFKLVSPGESPIDIPEFLSSLQNVVENNNKEQKQNTFKANQEGIESQKNAFAKICIFLEENGFKPESELRQIDEYFLNTDDELVHVHSLYDIAGTVEYINNKARCDIIMSGVVKLICLNFRLFTEPFPFASIRTLLLRICGLILSSVWQAGGIAEYVCDSVKEDSTLKTSISKDFRSLERFAVLLRGIENAENISERNIRQIMKEGKFCEEIASLAEIRGKIEYLTTKNEKVHESVVLILTFMRIAMLQLIALWQMYAIAKFPGHSEKNAEYVHSIIMLQRKNDQKLIEEFYGQYASSMNPDDLSSVQRLLQIFRV